ncbi:HAMP domain-containing sensor histidine kinase [Saccharibacillus sp. CPCC 101409]|uniref:sensor histidine kinase n=1 Tax=Saccharibacillus sp. CPCC 101409 TaxID=3058041 RepID=UPI002671F099|nr:HAMP domain-containing sensor histidine kinase [Saccharibacillus sp. CPCC 101409]MDO3410277.1 HAMP domain-containing sensor histidine kinase [Saccharibacillus sp. CPCC 101409]
MTIKRRLFISNILMIAIPIVLSILLAALVFLLVWKDFTGYRLQSDDDYYGARDSVMETARDMIVNPDAQRLSMLIERADTMLETNKMSLLVYEDDAVRYNLGSKELLSDADSATDAELAQALETLGGTGVAGKNGRELYVSELEESGHAYRIELLSDRPKLDASAEEDYGFRRAPVLLLLAMIAVVFLTSQFLTRSVFRNIRRPLEILTDGVREIRDGNLDYRIDYKRKDEFRAVCEAFNEMAGRLKESIRAVQKQEINRKELLAGISHDLRSPLTSIKAYSEGLLDGVAGTPESQRRYAGMIKTKAEDIDHMVSRLFLFSKMDLGDYPNYPEELDPREELESFFRAAAEEHAEQGLNVELNGLPRRLTLHADPVQFRRVLANLVENSLKYKERPEVSVKVSASTMGISGETLRIVVEDDGPGVTDEALPKLFDVFYRSDASRSSPNRGSGLGLAISEKAVSMMGGRIYAEHGGRGGLRIVIELPVRPSEKEA